jgi:hypothetical protein
MPIREGFLTFSRVQTARTRTIASTINTAAIEQDAVKNQK